MQLASDSPGEFQILEDTGTREQEETLGAQAGRSEGDGAAGDVLHRRAKSGDKELKAYGCDLDFDRGLTHRVTVHIIGNRLF